MLNNRLLGQDSTTSPSGRSGFPWLQNCIWAARGESMRKIFSNLQTTFRGELSFSLRTHACAWLLVLCGLGVTILVPAMSAQQLPTPSTASRSAKGSPQPVLTAATPKSAQQEAMPLHAPPPVTPEQAPPVAPQVTYEAGQLTIIAENSKLSDVMSALRACTGADVDLPAGSSGERIWARLGPGPARQILATLLSGTKLDYVIQASETDPDGIRNVWLTRRTESSAVAVARPVPQAARPLPPRLSDAERRVPVPNRSAAEDRAPDDAVPPDAATPTDAAPAVPPTQPAPADATPPTPAAGSQPQPAPAPDAAASSDAAASGASKPPTDTSGQMIQTLQNMYEQRKQMQLARTPQAPN
jgi:pyruvate dehydrogenase E2 component (dihydrolipoamide acetyltransferase)